MPIGIQILAIVKTVEATKCIQTQTHCMQDLQDCSKVRQTVSTRWGHDFTGFFELVIHFTIGLVRGQPTSKVRVQQSTMYPNPRFA